ncbi:aminopeptidase [Treponema rectale]|uniref:M18 family aminopeptidase n=1 Tax=Treponema rectale TaxID=744512 RepID=A0A7M1XHT6_9SPIR|nr:aminopeptidase [Treponema rectale]
MYAKNVWLDADETKKKAIFDFGKEYIDFLSNGKTERMATKEAIALAEAAGFKNLDTLKEIHPGDKVYAVNKNKNFLAAVIGDKSIEEGMRVLGAHIDSPRLDIKQNPLFEKGGFALFETHYYGGIKKYQYVTIPLALHGVVYKKDGSSFDVNIGEDKDDPVIGITDLLIHLSADQLQKTAAKAIEGEDLDITVGNIPLEKDEAGACKNYILQLLKDKYGMEEEDFLSSELHAVPAGPARDYGLDRSMIAGYGHDDKVCAYTSLRAVLDAGKQEYTSVVVLVDKEEVGSIGATGAQSMWFENVVAELLYREGKESNLAVRHAMTNTMMLSSDVSCAVDPIYPSANEANNSCYFGKGVVFNKYTGARGKSGCNDAMPEFLAFIRKAMDDNNLHYQTSEIGKVDQGGGGTIAYILGNYNMYVLDAGIPVLSMHSPMELVSKADVYEAYLAYKAFLAA